ncbi:MAG TPA: hypothetical protein VIM56_07935 [Rhizomicrobium sp.]
MALAHPEHFSTAAPSAPVEWPQILLRFLLLLSVFESDRSNFLFSEGVSRIKDVVIILFFASLLMREKWVVDRTFLRYSAYGWLLLFVLITLPITFYSSVVPYGMALNRGSSFSWAFYLRMIYFCLLAYSMRIYFHTYADDREPIAKLFVYLCIFFSIFNIVAYFYHFPFMATFRPQPGRISNGYPTSDALMLLMAVVAYFNFMPRTHLRTVCVLFVLVLGVLGNATASGITCLAMLGIFYLGTQVRRRPLFVVTIAFASLFALVILAVTAYFLMLRYAPTTLQALEFIYQYRSGEILALMEGGKTSLRSGGTFHVRVLEFTELFKYMESPIDLIFGLGAFYGYIENEYLHVFVVWGVIGAALFAATMIETITGALRENRVAAGYYLIIWAAAGMVLITTYLFPLFVPFAVFSQALQTGNKGPRNLAERRIVES